MNIEQNMTVDTDNVAEQVGKAMYAKDQVGRRLGMNIEQIRPGYARISMDISAEMINGHDICHGGYIFSLVDTACAYACNSYNQNTMSQAVNIVFMSPATLNDTLVAVAVESAHSGRTGTYEIKVTNHKTRVIAVAQAQCRTVRGRMVEDLPLLRDAAND
ncbi:MAG: hydroxyphenylacetyl-CoA thioesterase PaaI [Desulfuromonadaceae bacterium]|nr:hydroxyphenylacetyl-CoA thioesterase PaaI [Desulfuromonadaceae bacterium]